MNNSISMISEQDDTAINREKIYQCREEMDSWKRILQFLQSEIGYMKVRLIHIVNMDISYTINTKVSRLQSALRDHHQRISEIRRLITSLDKRIDHCDHSAACVKDIFKTKNTIRTKIEKLENDFMLQRKTFNNQLTEFQ